MNALRPLLSSLVTVSLALAAVSLLAPPAAASPCTTPAAGMTCVGYCEGRDAMCDNPQGTPTDGSSSCIFLGPTSPPLTPCTPNNNVCGGPGYGCTGSGYYRGYDAECIIGPGLTAVTCQAYVFDGTTLQTSCGMAVAPTPGFPNCLPVPVGWCPGMFPAPPTAVGVVVGGSPACVVIPTATPCPGMLAVPPTSVGVIVTGTVPLFLCVAIPPVVPCPGMLAVPPTAVGVVVGATPVCVPVPPVAPCPGLLAVPPTVGVIVGTTPICVTLPTVGLCPGMLPLPPTAVGVVIGATPLCFVLPAIALCPGFGTVPPPPGSLGIVINGFPACV